MTCICTEYILYDTYRLTKIADNLRLPAVVVQVVIPATTARLFIRPAAATAQRRQGGRGGVGRGGDAGHDGPQGRPGRLVKRGVVSLVVRDVQRAVEQGTPTEGEVGNFRRDESNAKY